MTPQEAINRLTDIVEVCSGGRGPATLHGEPLPREYEEFRKINFGALDMAVAALEKQIPKKRHKNYEGYSAVWCDCGWYLGKQEEGKKYCPNCGQAIDWSD